MAISSEYNYTKIIKLCDKKFVNFDIVQYNHIIILRFLYIKSVFMILYCYKEL